VVYIIIQAKSVQNGFNSLFGFFIVDIYRKRGHLNKNTIIFRQEKIDGKITHAAYGDKGRAARRATCQRSTSTPPLLASAAYSRLKGKITYSAYAGKGVQHGGLPVSGAREAGAFGFRCIRA